MSNLPEKSKMRWKVFIVGSFFVAVLCTIIFLFTTTYENKEKIIVEDIRPDAMQEVSAVENAK